MTSMTDMIYITNITVFSQRTTVTKLFFRKKKDFDFVKNVCAIN